MKRGVFVMAVALALLGCIGGGVAVAQDVTVVNVPIKFTVGQKVMEPGRYELQMNDDRSAITLTPARGPAIFVPTITRLAAMQPIGQGKVVFDKVGEAYYLSEIWLPTEDGFLVKDTKQPHQHHVVSAEKKKIS